MGDGQILNGHGRAIIAVSVIFSALAILSVALRFLVRVRMKTCYYLDDWIIVAALVSVFISLSLIDQQLWVRY